MTFFQSIGPSLEALKTQYARNKLLLIHPSSRHRTLLVAALIQDPPCPIYYFALSANDVSLSQFLSSLTHDLADQHSTFGKYLNDARKEQLDNYEALARATAADLHEIEDSDFILVIDEYDRADTVPEIQTFVEYLLNELPENCHLLINSRSLPRLPWVALVAKNEAVVLRDARLLTSGFYSESFTENPNVEVFALGPGYVMLNGQHVDTWEGHLPRLLFFFALDRPMATRADICQAFWPELPIDQAVNVFHVTKRRLHKALGFDVLMHEGGHYRISQAINLSYDVLDFVSSLLEARNTPDKDIAAEHWHYAVDLYRGDYLQGHNDEWIVARRADFRSGYLEAIVSLADLQEQAGNDEVALGLYLRATGEASQREDIHREVIRLYGKLGRRSEAAEHYSKVANEMKRQHGLEPSPETQRIYHEAIGE